MKTKEIKGITLVALVITIVVLLILAGVSINTVLGDDGIIKKAKEAAEATKQASAEEEMNRLVLEYQLASNDETLESFLQEKVTEGRIDGVTDNGDGTITITKKVEGKDYTITVKITVDQFKMEINLDDVQIGDSVNYTYDSAESYSLSSTYSGYSSNQTITQTTGLTWKVLNVDKENDTVDIISTNPTSSTVRFYGALGYHNGPYIMNKICEELYSNSALNVKARNICLLDMENHLTKDGIATRNKYANSVQYGKTKTYKDNYSYYPLLYDGQKGAGVNVTVANASTIIQPDTTKGNDPYSESVDTTGPLTDKTYKQADNKVLTVTQTLYSIPINEANYGEAYKVLNNSTPYWVSARYVYTNSNVAVFGMYDADMNLGGYNMFYSNKDGYDYDDRLRPVVSLPSSLLTGEQTNGAWNLR